MAAMKILVGVFALVCLYASTQATSIYHPPKGAWGPWGQWCKCSKLCGGGDQYRTRMCKTPYTPCEGKAKQTRACNTQGCKVDGGWSDWSDYTTCSKTCKSGTQSRTRTCTNPAPANGGKECVGDSSQSRVCNNDVPCPVPGGWSDWSDYSKCSKSCKSGTQSRTRTCTKPAPAYGGEDCVGDSSQSRVCNNDVPCPVDGEWSDWSDYTTCSKTCQSGTQSRTRTCSNPAPANGGKDCEGDSSESRVCNNDVLCPVDGGWSDWSDYSACSKTCRKGTQSRTRTCTKPAPANGGKDCKGDASQSRSCNANVPCPVSVRFDPLNYKAVESDDVTVMIVRSGDLQQATTVFLSTSDGSAKKLTDYRPRNKLPVNFQSGEKLKKVVIDIINDKKVEQTERFFAELSSDNPSVQIVPAGRNATIRIDDDDSQFRFQKILYSVKENAGKANLVILRSGSTNSKQTARVQTKDGSAVSTANGDFQSVGNPNPFSVVFAAGEKQKTVSVNIIDDKADEQKEKFTVILSTDDARATVNDAFDVATVYILDNDVDGGWGKWSPWSTCNKSCGFGRKYRTRKCNNPAPQGGGSQCVGKPKQSRPCYIKRYCPINGGYGAWSAWSSCSATCGAGSCTRRRICNKPKPQYGGAVCGGGYKQSRKCYLKACPYAGMGNAYRPTRPAYQPETRPPVYQPKTRPPVYQPETKPPAYQPQTNPPKQPYY